MDIRDIKIIRSKRKNAALEIKPDGTVIIRAPIRLSYKEIESFALRHMDWIDGKLASLKKEMADFSKDDILSEEELRNLTEAAKKYIPGRVRFYADKIGVDYGRITIRRQKTRWGSCSSLGNLNFNCLLMLTPPEVIDSVVVHELCHRKHMNHSSDFYSEILKVFPEYYTHQKWLKENGRRLMRRLIG